jgi:hypothetical protein
MTSITRKQRGKHVSAITSNTQHLKNCWKPCILSGHCRGSTRTKGAVAGAIMGYVEASRTAVVSESLWWISYRSSLDLVVWTKRVLDRARFTNHTLRSVLTANSRLVERSPARKRVCAVVYIISKQRMNLSVHQDGGRPITGIAEILGTESSTANLNVMPWSSFCGATRL